MDKPTSRIGGDFAAETIDAFRAAYAQQLASPDQEEVANNSGLPTNTIGNTSPWIETTGLWKYPSGKGPEDDLKQVFNPNDYLPEEALDEDNEVEGMSEEEVNNLIDEISGNTEGDYETEEEEG